MKTSISPVFYTIFIICFGILTGSLLCLVLMDKQTPDYSQTMEIVKRASWKPVAAPASHLGIGKKYLFSLYWDLAQGDPFIKISVDTVKVLEYKKGYVRYRNLSQKWDTYNRLETFERFTRPLFNPK